MALPRPHKMSSDVMFIVVFVVFVGDFVCEMLLFHILLFSISLVKDLGSGRDKFNVLKQHNHGWLWTILSTYEDILLGNNVSDLSLSWLNDSHVIPDETGSVLAVPAHVQ